MARKVPLSNGIAPLGATELKIVRPTGNMGSLKRVAGGAGSAERMDRMRSVDPLNLYG